MSIYATGSTGELARVVQKQMFCHTVVAIQVVLWLNNVRCWYWLPELLSDLSARLLEESNILYGWRVWLQVVSKDVVGGNLKIILNNWFMGFVNISNNTPCRQIDLLVLIWRFMKPSSQSSFGGSDVLSHWTTGRVKHVLVPALKFTRPLCLCSWC